MASIVLRAASSDFSVDSFLQLHSSLEPEAVWHVGETRIPGRTPAATSGFNLRLADDDDDVGALKQARVEIARYRAALEQLRDAGVRTCIDVGLFVGAAFSRNLQLSMYDLRLLADIGVELEVSVYPCDDDADTESSAEQGCLSGRTRLPASIERRFLPQFASWTRLSSIDVAKPSRTAMTYYWTWASRAVHRTKFTALSSQGFLSFRSTMMTFPARGSA